MFVRATECTDEHLIELEKHASHNALLEATKSSFRA